MPHHFNFITAICSFSFFVKQCCDDISILYPLEYPPRENKPTLQFLTSADKLKAAIYHTSFSQDRAAPMRPANAAAAATTTQSGSKKGERV
jgi:hypothetical protein